MPFPFSLLNYIKLTKYMKLLLLPDFNVGLYTFLQIIVLGICASGLTWYNDRLKNHTNYIDHSKN